jgi:hypothetical protein
MWTVAVATGESNALTVVAFVIALPAAPFIEVELVLLFSLLRFDPTTSAPLWQNVLSGSIVIVCMTGGAVADALILRLIASAIRGRRSGRVPRSLS